MSQAVVEVLKAKRKCSPAFGNAVSGELHAVEQANNIGEAA